MSPKLVGYKECLLYVKVLLYIKHYIQTSRVYTVLGVWWENRNLIPGRGKNILFMTAFIPALGLIQPPVQWVPGASNTSVKDAKRDFIHQLCTVQNTDFLHKKRQCSYRHVVLSTVKCFSSLGRTVHCGLVCCAFAGEMIVTCNQYNAGETGDAHGKVYGGYSFFSCDLTQCSLVEIHRPFEDSFCVNF
jgi:hypothetical protein